MAEEIAALPGLRLRPRLLALLTEQGQPTTAAGFAAADRRELHDALRRAWPRPTLEEISQWQDQARDLLSRGGNPTPEWFQVAAFMVSFERRDHDGQQRVIVEQAEHPSPPPHQTWDTWTLAHATAWILEQLRQSSPTEEQPQDPPPPAAQQPPAPEHPQHQTSSPASPATRPKITVQALHLASATTQTLDLLTAPPTITLDIPPAGQLHVKLSQPARVAARLRRPGHPSISLHQTATGPDGNAQLHLENLPTGASTVVLAAWANDGSAAPVIHPLPPLNRQ